MAPSKPVTVALLGAGARGELNLASLARERPDLIKFTAVAEPHQGRRENFVKNYGVPPKNAFADWRELAEKTV
jgi:predicted dehydrogenase